MLLLVSMIRCAANFANRVAVLGVNLSSSETLTSQAKAGFGDPQPRRTRYDSQPVHPHHV